MQILFITRGIQGSGKSTFAKKWVREDPLNRARVNRDDIRMGTFNSYVLPPELEHKVTKIEHANIEALLKAGMSVIVDNMNLRPKYIKEYLKIAAKYNAVVLHKDFPVELEDALARNKQRDRVVDEKVIRDTFKTFIRKGSFLPFPTLEDITSASIGGTYVPDVTKPTAILVDVDGTAVKMSPERGPFDWDKVLLDSANEPVIEAVKAMKAAGHKIIVMSGRDSVSREDTEAHLREIGIDFDACYMRPQGDQRKDSIIKDELFDAHIRYNYNVLFALDDRDQVVDHYRRELGLTVFQVDYGDF